MIPSKLIRIAGCQFLHNIKESIYYRNMQSCNNPYLVQFGILKRDAPVMQTCPVMLERHKYLEAETILLEEKYWHLFGFYAKASRSHTKQDLASYRRAYTEYTGFMDNLQDEIKDFVESPNACPIMTLYGEQFQRKLDMYDEFLKQLIHLDDFN